MSLYALIVDPVARRRTGHAHLTKSFGLAAEEVETGELALETIRVKGPPAVVVTELSLPGGIDGFALLKELKRAAPKSPVIVVSAFAELRNTLLQRRAESPHTAMLAAQAPLSSLSRILGKVLEAAPKPSAPAHVLASVGPPPKPVGPADLQRMGLLGDGQPDAQLTELLEEVAKVCGVPMALITFILADRQWFKAHTGLGGRILEERGTPISSSFCRHVVDAQAPLIVPDAVIHPLFAKNDLVTSGVVRGYAGVPILGASGKVFGTLCVLDSKPMKLAPAKLEALWLLARRVAGELELRTGAAAPVTATLPVSIAAAAPLIEALDAGILLMNGEDRRVVYANQALARLTGISREQIMKMSRDEWVAQNTTLFDDPRDFLKKLKVLPKGPFVACEEFEVQRPEPRLIRWTAKPLRLGESVLQLAIYDDVTPVPTIGGGEVELVGEPNFELDV